MKPEKLGAYMQQTILQNVSGVIQPITFVLMTNCIIN